MVKIVIDNRIDSRVIKVEDCTKIGDKYYLNEELQKIFDNRIKSVIPIDK